MATYGDLTCYDIDQQLGLLPDANLQLLDAPFEVARRAAEGQRRVVRGNDSRTR